jgi:SAM-dependent methyltransferase
MKPKPRGLGPEYGAQFRDESVVAAYRTRPPYPEQLMTLVLEIAGRSDLRVLDLGCGTGEVARRLAPRVAAVTAVDCSWRMIETARDMPGGDATNIEWVVAPVEELTLRGPFSVALAAESFHWFEWDRACERVGALVPSRELVLIEGRLEAGSPWAGELSPIIARYSTNREFEPYDLVDELAARSCLEVRGRVRLGPEPWHQAVDDYITSIHSRNGFSCDRMTSADMRAFDDAVRDVVGPHARSGVIELNLATDVAWGLVPAHRSSGCSGRPVARE